MRIKFKLTLLLFLVVLSSSFSQRGVRNWMSNFYSSSELLLESSLDNSNIRKRLIKSFKTSSLEAKKALRLLDIPPKDIQKITEKFSEAELAEIAELLVGLSPRATKSFFSDLARYSNNNKIQNLITVIKKDKRVLDSYERASGFLGVKFRTDIGVLLQIADGKTPIKIKTTVSQKYKHLYRKKQISSNGLVFEGYFPDFKDYRAYDMVLPKNLIKSSDTEQMKHCTKQLRKELINNPKLKDKFTKEQLKAIENGERTIPGYTWHHSESRVGKMELVESSIHEVVKHDGGVAFWGGGLR